MDLFEETAIKQLLGIVRIFYGDGRESDLKILQDSFSGDIVSPLGKPAGSSFDLLITERLVINTDNAFYNKCNFVIKGKMDIGIIVKGRGNVFNDCSFDVDRNVDTVISFMGNYNSITNSHIHYRD